MPLVPPSLLPHLSLPAMFLGSVVALDSEQVWVVPPSPQTLLTPLSLPAIVVVAVPLMLVLPEQAQMLKPLVSLPPFECLLLPRLGSVLPMLPPPRL